MPFGIIHVYSYSKKVVIVNSRYWNRRKLWGSNFSSNLLLLVLTLHNIECRLIMMPRPYSNKLFWCIISRYDSYQQFLSVPVLTIDYDNLFWNIYIWNKKNVNDTESSCWHMGIVCRNGMLAGTFRTQKFFYPTSSFRCSPRGFSATCYNKYKVRWLRVLARPLQVVHNVFLSESLSCALS